LLSTLADHIANFIANFRSTTRSTPFGTHDIPHRSLSTSSLAAKMSYWYVPLAFVYLDFYMSAPFIFLASFYVYRLWKELGGE
jgi:hypothetical protein